MIFRRFNRLFLCLAIVLGILGVQSQTSIAQVCTATTPDVDFGNVDLTGGASVQTNVRMTIDCTGTPGLWVRVCVNFGSGTGNVDPSGDPRYMLNGANQLDYSLYKNNAATNVWGSWLWPYPPNGKTVRVRIRNNGTGRRRPRIRAQIKASQADTPPGAYLSSFAGGHTLIAYAYDTVGNCNLISSFGGFQSPFTVLANVIGACTVNTTDLNFGTAGVLTANVDTANTVSVLCSPGIAYTVGLSNGSSGGTSPTNRLMANGGDTTTYGIYSDAARTTPWGDTIGTNTVAGVGSGFTQNFTGYGRVSPQTTPPPGTYSDTITITVTY